MVPFSQSSNIFTDHDIYLQEAKELYIYHLQSKSAVIWSILQASLLLIPLFFVRYDLHFLIYDANFK